MKQASLLTWGCTHNQKDSQHIESQLIGAGFTILPEEDMMEADVVILNTCTVKTPTENKIIHVLDKLKATDKKVIVSGCLSQTEPEFLRKRYPQYILLGVNAASHILPSLNSIEDNGNLIHLMPKLSGKRNIKDNSVDWIEKPLLSSTQWNSHRNIVQINEGCLNFCTFCATKKARGHLRSFQKESIIHSIRSVHSQEVWLTSQDTACWGFDINDNLAGLISEIDKIERKFWVRIGMGNPNNFIKFLDEIVEAYQSDKIYKFLHLPVQSGNNEVLKHMRRGYTVEEYEFIVKEFKHHFPEITLSTDVICGYPTESELDFEDTIQTIEKTRPSITNISRYWERRGTPAADFAQLPYNVRKQRSQILSKLCKDIQVKANQKWIGWKGEVYMAETGPKGGIQGRNLAYKPIIIDVPDDLLGTWQPVEITDSTSTYFMGDLIH